MVATVSHAVSLQRPMVAMNWSQGGYCESRSFLATSHGGHELVPILQILSAV